MEFIEYNHTHFPLFSYTTRNGDLQAVTVLSVTLDAFNIFAL